MSWRGRRSSRSPAWRRRLARGKQDRPNGPGYLAPDQARAPPRRRRRAPQFPRRAAAADVAGPDGDGIRYLDGLDPQQRAAATADGPLLIIAGPGSGKTRTLTYRIAHQITDRGVAAGDFLAITFTRRAAQEVQDRLAGLCPGQPTVTTFHGLGLRILREHHEAAGLARGSRSRTRPQPSRSPPS